MKEKFQKIKIVFSDGDVKKFYGILKVDNQIAAVVRKEFDKEEADGVFRTYVLLPLCNVKMIVTEEE